MENKSLPKKKKPNASEGGKSECVVERVPMAGLISFNGIVVDMVTLILLH